jgi:transaldolase
MRLLLDTANLEAIQWGLATGVIDGVSTNPALLARALTGDDPAAHVAAICRLVAGPVTVQVISVDAEGIYREAKELAKVADNVVVEIPMIEEGLVATRRLVPEGVRVNVTLVFTLAQALLAAKAGAAYVSPFVGRLDDAGGDGIALLADVRRLFDYPGFECEVLASSIRTPRRFADAARAGADAAAVPPDVLRSLLLHPLTDLGLEQFRAEWGRQLARSRSAE